MTKPTQEQIKSFLDDLALIQKKHGLRVSHSHNGATIQCLCGLGPNAGASDWGSYWLIVDEWIDENKNERNHQVFSKNVDELFEQQWPEGHFNHPDFVDDFEPDVEAIAAHNAHIEEKLRHARVVDSIFVEPERVEMADKRHDYAPISEDELDEIRAACVEPEFTATLSVENLGLFVQGDLLMNGKTFEQFSHRVVLADEIDTGSDESPETDEPTFTREEWKDIRGNLGDCLRKYHPSTQPVAHLQIKALIDKIDSILK